MWNIVVTNVSHNLRARFPSACSQTQLQMKHVAALAGDVFSRGMWNSVVATVIHTCNAVAGRFAITFCKRELNHGLGGVPERR